ncbi:uncharacterized protein LOC131440050 isoform X1 [Malaya genurostris]|uniref:uncharacterized protein LOC131440050 isoform X1 n=1 Tax=Malaya genurostris TaxID=325434 RepID=UPI0026F3941F|nr:uncharacterized protein LOC131440050 isoform X1 [Malaya genurostris]
MFDKNDATEWLFLNHEPWSTVLETWSTSFGYRKQFLQKERVIPKLLDTFSHYKSVHGYQLVSTNWYVFYSQYNFKFSLLLQIDIDFRLLNASASNYSQKIATVIPAVVSFATTKAVDPSANELVKALTDSLASDDTKHCALLLLLNTVLPPTSAAFRFKPTIRLAQEDTIIFAASLSEARLKVQNIYETYIERNLPVVPKLIALGSDYKSLEGRFFVQYNDICYEFKSARRATDVLIKLSVVFGLQSSRISKLVWNFIKHFAYDIKQRESYASINNLLHYLSGCEAGVSYNND